MEAGEGWGGGLPVHFPTFRISSCPTFRTFQRCEGAFVKDPRNAGLVTLMERVVAR
jgi:hypothetical protein